MTDPQHDAILSQLFELDDSNPITAVHHGCCVGADCQFHELAFQIGRHVDVIKWPCNHPTDRRECEGGRFAPQCFDPDNLPKPLDRNRWMVDQADVVIAAAPTSHEVLRSGTWATIRYALSQQKPVKAFDPQGRQLILH